MQRMILSAAGPALLALLLVAAIAATAYVAAIETTGRVLTPGLARLSAARLAADLDALARALRSAPPGDAARAPFDGGIVALDAANTVIDAPEPMWWDENWSNRDIVRRLRNSTGPAFGQIQDPSGQGERFAAVAVTQPDTASQEDAAALLGLLRIDTATGTLGTMTETSRPETAGALMLVDAGGLVLAHTHPTGIGRNLAREAPVEAVLRGETGAVGSRNLEGERVIAAYAPVPGTTWSVVVEHDTGALAALAWTNGQPAPGPIAAWLAALLVLAPTLAVARAARRVVKELAQLRRATHRTVADLTGAELASAPAEKDEVAALAHDLAAAAAYLTEVHERLTQSDRALHLAGAWRQALRSQTADQKDPEAWLEELCRLAVELGGCQLAWVGEVQQDLARTIRPVAVVEVTTGDQASTGIARSAVWSESSRGRGPAGTAIRTGEPVLLENATEGPQDAAWTIAAQQCDCNGIVALPLTRHGETTRAVVLYTVRPFEPHAVAVLLHALKP